MPKVKLIKVDESESSKVIQFERNYDFEVEQDDGNLALCATVRYSLSVFDERGPIGDQMTYEFDSDLTLEEKKLVLAEIKKDIQQNCFSANQDIKFVEEECFSANQDIKSIQENEE